MHSPPLSLNRLALARWVSIVAHPFVIALVLAGAVEPTRTPAAVARTVAVVALLFVLPLALLMRRQLRRGAWTTVDASRPRERPILFAVGGAGLAALIAYLARTRPGSPLVTGAVGVVLMVAFCAAMTPWVKVSLHMAAAALAAAVLLARGLPLGWPLAAMLPALGWSRVALGRHRWLEVMLGFLVGAGSGVAIAHVA